MCGCPCSFPGQDAEAPRMPPVMPFSLRSKSSPSSVRLSSFKQIASRSFFFRWGSLDFRWFYDMLYHVISFYMISYEFLSSSFPPFLFLFLCSPRIAKLLASAITETDLLVVKCRGWLEESLFKAGLVLNHDQGLIRSSRTTTWQRGDTTHLGWRVTWKTYVNVV